MSTPIQRPRATEDPTAEARRNAPAKLVLALHRLVKACLLYNDQNQAVVALAPVAAAAVAELCALRDAASARVLFADQIVFVNKRILKGSRETSAIGLELGALLAKVGVTELVLERGVTREAIGGFARAVADAPRDPAAQRRLFDGSFRGITARHVDLDDADVMPEIEKSTVARVVRNYAASVLLLQRTFEALERGDLHYGNRAKRVAQKLVALGDDDPQLLVALAASRFTSASPARIAVSTAVIAVAMARQLTSDPVALASLAMAALLADVGRLRIGEALAAKERRAASALVVLTALGRLEQGSMARTVIAHEALRLENGPPLEGAPVLLAEILCAARRFNELRTPVGGVPGAGIDVAIEVMTVAATEPAARTLLRLLVAGLGFFPIGTMVELSTGEVAIVMGAPAMSVDFARPPVQIVADARGMILDRPITVNLKKAHTGQPSRSIRRALPVDPSRIGG